MTDTITKNVKYLKDTKISNLTPFLIGLIDIPIKEFMFEKSGFINCYYRCDYDKNNTDYKKRVYIVFDKSIMSVECMDKLSAKVTFLKSLYLEHVIIMVFVPLQEFNTDFMLLQKGLYSKLSINYKRVLLNLFSKNVDGSTNTNSGLYKTLYQTEENRQSVADKYQVKLEDIQEIKSVPNLIKETFYESTIYSMDFN